MHFASDLVSGVGRPIKDAGAPPREGRSPEMMATRSSGSTTHLGIRVGESFPGRNFSSILDDCVSGRPLFPSVPCAGIPSY